MIIEKNTLEAGIVRYTITSSKHPDVYVNADIYADGNNVTIGVFADGVPHGIGLHDDQIDLLRQALQFIDGEKHKAELLAKEPM